MPVVPPAQEVNADLAFKGVLSPETESPPPVDNEDSAATTTQVTID